MGILRRRLLNDFGDAASVSICLQQIQGGQQILLNENLWAS
jgi:hypothetical protein